MTDSWSDTIEERPWRLRPAILALAGLLAALAVQQLTDRGLDYGQIVQPLAFWRYALASGIGAGALAFGFGLERVRWAWSAVFGLAIGVVVALVIYWNGAPAGGGFPWDWSAASLLLSVAIFVPLFQTARDEGRARFPYPDVHSHAWTNVVLWCACWAFVGIVIALAWLLASLFELIGLTFLRRLLDHDWAIAMLVGASFGAALGLLRDRDRVVRLLQRVVTAVLAVLAPVLALGLGIFLLALPFTGLHALWDATKATTPILLSCVIGGLILANAVIGNGVEDELRNPVLRGGGIVLALCLLPLAVIAAIATGLRIGQHGFTPDRLWAVVFVAFAAAYGLAYLASLVRGRGDWARFARPANLHLAFAVAGVALFLAMPILSFNSISARDQVARLQSGKIGVSDFDWAALAFDFGDPGRAALKRLAASANPALKARATEVAAKTSRWDVTSIDQSRKNADALVGRLRVLPDTAPVPEDLRELLGQWSACGGNDTIPCTLLFSADGTEAFAIDGDCGPSAKAKSDSLLFDVGGANCSVARFHREGAAWKDGAPPAAAPSAQALAQRKADLAAGKVEVRTVPRRQVFIGGKPVGDSFE